MEHASVQPTTKGPALTFTGEVYVTPIAGPSGGSRASAALVRFTPGARSNRHSHDAGQVLHGADGVGLVANRAGQVLTIRPDAASEEAR
jgi:quercetin dioxygenase-like cupin family protein